MAKIDAKALLDDARGRDAALIALLLAGDRKATDLFRVYVTIGVAVASAVAAGVAEEFFGSAVYPIVALLTSLACLAAGSWFCFAAMMPVKVILPGRGSDFWRWSRDPSIDEEIVLDWYLRRSDDAWELNNEVNVRAAARLEMALRFGILAFVWPVLVVLCGWQSP